MRLQRSAFWMDAHRSFFPDLIRIYLGFGLLIKGAFFLLHPGSLTGISPFAASVVNAVPYIHILGGLFLALGLGTRVAALSQIPIVAGALVAVNLPHINGMQAREAVEFSALTLFVLLLITAWGGGPLSLDHHLRRRPVGWRDESWFGTHRDLFMDLLRAYLGVGLFVKGVYILEHQNEFQKLIENTGTMPLSLLAAAHYIIPIHFVGGVMLLLGLATRFAAVAQIPLLFGAIFYVYLPRFSTLELRQNLEFTGLVLFLLCALAIHGSGRYSLDYVLHKAERERDLPETHDLHESPAHA